MAFPSVLTNIVSQVLLTKNVTVLCISESPRLSSLAMVEKEKSGHWLKISFMYYPFRTVLTFMLFPTIKSVKSMVAASCRFGRIPVGLH